MASVCPVPCARDVRDGRVQVGHHGRGDVQRQVLGVEVLAVAGTRRSAGIRQRGDGRVGVHRDPGRAQRAQQPPARNPLRCRRAPAASRPRCTPTAGGSWSSPGSPRPSPVGGWRRRRRGSCRPRSRSPAPSIRSTTAWISPGPASRDDHVDQAAGGHQVRDRLPVGAGHQRARRPPATRPRCRPRRDRTSTSARLERVRGAGTAQQHGVPGLQRDPGGVDGDVGPGLVDDRHHAERHPDLPQLQAVGQHRAAHHSPTGSGSADQRSQAGRPSPSTRDSVSRNRSTSAAEVPAATAGGDVLRRWRPGSSSAASAAHRPSRQRGVLGRAGSTASAAAASGAPRGRQHRRARASRQAPGRLRRRPGAVVRRCDPVRAPGSAHPATCSGRSAWTVIAAS